MSEKRKCKRCTKNTINAGNNSELCQPCKEALGSGSLAKLEAAYRAELAGTSKPEQRPAAAPVMSLPTPPISPSTRRSSPLTTWSRALRSSAAASPRGALPSLA